MAIDASEVRRQIGVGLRRVAQEMGMSQLEIARRMGVSGPSVNLWMSGESRFPLERVPELCRAVGVPVETMVYEMGLTDREPEYPLEALAAERIRAARESSRQPAQTTHTTTRRGWHGAAKEGEMPGKPRDRDLHGAYKVGQTPAFAQALAAY